MKLERSLTLKDNIAPNSEFTAKHNNGMEGWKGECADPTHLIVQTKPKRISYGLSFL